MKKILIAVSLIIGIKSFAQKKLDFDPTAKPISIWNLKESNWAAKGSVFFHPFLAKSNTATDNGEVLFSSKTGSINSNLNSENFRLRLEFMLDASGSVLLKIGDKNLQLSKNNPGSIEAGKLKIKPMQNALRAASLWQNLDLVFKNGNTLEYVTLNGVAIHQQVIFPGKSNSNSISLENLEGSVAIRNVDFNVLENAKNISLKNITFEIVETKQWDSMEPSSKPKLNGKLEELSLDFPANTYKNHFITQSGNLFISKKDKYLFTVQSSGRAELILDGKSIIKKTDFNFEIDGEKIIELEPGEHTFSLIYQYPPWWSKALAWSVRSNNMVAYDLHSKSMVQERYQPGEIDIPLGAVSENIRSFQLFKDKKLTQVISSGSPTAYHFSYDLDQASPLYFWKGEFADVTEMWHERGEPQILEPKGLRVINSGQNPVIGQNLVFSSYILDNNQVPTFIYTSGGNVFQNKIQPSTSGLSYSFLENSGGTFELKISEGKNIQKLDANTYKTDDRVFIFPKNSNLKLSENQGVKTLTATVKKEITYSILF
jgi:hypothetical protein